MGLWSSGDFALTERQMRESAAFCAGGFSYVRIEGAGHWIPLEAPRELSAALIEFFAADLVVRQRPLAA